MQLPLEQKTKLIHSSKAIYDAYVALYFAKEPLFKEGDSQRTLDSIVSDAIKANRINTPFTIQFQNEQHVLLINDALQVEFVDITPKGHPELKEYTQYSNDEKLNSLSSPKFTAKKDKKGNYTLGLDVNLDNNQVICLGGPDKFDLYPEHLSTLFNIQQHIAQEGDVSSMLIALATGAGKTFVQALWMLVLKHAGISGIFAVPNQLVEQFKDDLKSLLPDQMVQEIKTIKENQPNDEGIAALNALETAPQIILGSYEELLDRHYHTLNSLNHVALSFDEQHVVITREKREIQLAELASKNLTMLLTATPNQKTYELCGNKPVAYMSSKQKADANHGLFPKLETFRAINLDDREGQNHDNHITMGDQMFLRFADSFLEQRSSPILSLFEKFQYDNQAYLFNDANDFHALRWSYQPPTSRKMLCIIDNHEELINLNNAINKTDKLGDQKPYSLKILEHFDPSMVNDNEVVFYKENDRWVATITYSFQPNITIPAELIYKIKLNVLLDKYSLTKNKADERKILDKISDQLSNTEKHAQSPNLPVYKDGNLLPRERVYKFMYQEENDVDKKIANEYRKHKQQIRAKDPVEQVSLAEQLDRNVFSGIVNYIFSDLTKLSTIELNEKRKDHFNEIYELIDSELKNTTHGTEYYENKLKYHPINNPKGIDEAGAKQLAVIMHEIISLYKPLNRDQKRHFIENWTLTNRGRDELLVSKNEALYKTFTDYTNKHRALYVMKGMDQAETPIKEDAPFFGFSEQIINQKNKDGTLSKEAKNRERTVFEILDTESKEYHYEPDYDANLSETIADNYFKLGFVGMYVSNKKTEGFSDLNLHTVISTVPEEVDSNNDPAKSIQGLGRLRGKDSTQQPLYFNTSARHVSPAFDLALLNQDGDYYPAYFAAKSNFNHNTVEFIGKNIGKSINDYLVLHRNEYDEINYREYNDAVQLIILEAFREIYNNNSHDLALSKEHLRSALDFASAYLDEQLAKLKTPYQLDPLTDFVGSVINFADNITYYFKAKETKNNFNAFAEALREHHPKVNPDILYANIIEKSDISRLNEKNSTFIEFKNLFEKKAKYIERQFKGKIIEAMGAEDINACNDNLRNNLLANFVKYINPAKQDTCLMEASKFGDWHRVFIVEHQLLAKFGSASTKERAEIAIELFKKVPSLQYFLSAKNDAFNPVNQLVKNDLVPVFAKFFIPQAQATVTERLSQFENWDRLIAQIPAEKLNQLQDNSLDASAKLKLINDLSMDLITKTQCFDPLFLQQNKRNYANVLKSSGETIQKSLGIAFGKVKALNTVDPRNWFNKKAAQHEKQADNALAVYISGDFITQIEPLFIKKDLDILKDLFTNKKIATDFSAELYKEIDSKSIDDLKSNPNFLVDFIKQFFAAYDNGQYHEQVNSIALAPERLEKATQAMQTPRPMEDGMNAFIRLIQDKYHSLTTDLKESVIENEILPIISDADFQKTILDSVGHLQQEDIEQFVKILYPEEGNELSAEIYDFVLLLKNAQYSELFAKYFKQAAVEQTDLIMQSMNAPDANQPIEIPFFKIFAVIDSMRQEQVRCHKHFNNVLEGTQEKSILVDKIGVGIADMQIEPDVVRDEVSVFQLHALQTGMEINSRIRENANQKHIALLNDVNQCILNPMINTLAKTGPHVIKSKVFSGSRDINSQDDLIDSSTKLAERINNLTPLNKEEVNLGINYTDAIDFLIKPITQLPSLSYLTDWWYQKSQPSTSYFRFNEVKNIDECINHCDVRSNQDLGKIYQLTTGFLRNTANYVFSMHYEDVRQLRRIVYTQMVHNLRVEKGSEYSELIENLKDHLNRLKQIDNKDQFYSTTMNQIEKILLDSTKTDSLKLVAIQFLARDLNSSRMHNARRFVSHLFSEHKSKEGKEVSEFCQVLGKANLIDAGQPGNLNEWLSQKKLEQDVDLQQSSGASSGIAG